MTVKISAAIDTEAILRSIVVIRGHRVLLDSELASLYEVETKALTRAVRRNADRFPRDFMYQLTVEEASSLRSQTGAFKAGRGKHRKYAPYVFTEHGVAMLSSVLNSKRAVQVNSEIMRAFVRLRQAVSTQKNLARKLQLWRKNMTANLKLCLTQSADSCVNQSLSAGV
jgi:hypothetical protein